MKPRTYLTQETLDQFISWNFGPILTHETLDRFKLMKPRTYFNSLKPSTDFNLWNPRPILTHKTLDRFNSWNPGPILTHETLDRPALNFDLKIKLNYGNVLAWSRNSKLSGLTCTRKTPSKIGFPSSLFNKMTVY